MTTSAAPAYLYLQLSGSGSSTAYLEELEGLPAEQPCRLFGKGDRSTVECLEAGTPPAEVALFQFDDAQQAGELWNSDANRRLLAANGLAGDPGTLALLAPGLPYSGLPEAPEIPTIASVQPPPGRGPRYYMIIQGTGTDQVRMDKYRDIILPMMAELGSYYIAFNIGAGIETLAGTWPWEIFAISRWPDYRAGHDFWDSDRYRNVAVPLRTGAGTFHVHFFKGETG